jgi:hypothetical protein
VDGLGVGTLVGFALNLGLVLVVMWRLYGFRFSGVFLRLLGVLTLFCLAAFGLTMAIDSGVWGSLATVPVLAATCWFCWRELNGRMDISGLIKERFKR